MGPVVLVMGAKCEIDWFAAILWVVIWVALNYWGIV